MLEKILLILILILQAIFSGLIFSNSESSFNWDAFSSLFQSIILIAGFFVGYLILKKEILFKQKLEVHGKLTSVLVEKLSRSLCDVSVSAMNSFFLKSSNPKDKDDYPTKNLREKNKELGKCIGGFQSDFQVFRDLFQFWKALFSEKVDREAKFLSDLEMILCEDLWKYQNKLGDYSMLSLMKDEADIERERKELLFIEENLSRKINVLANGLDKFISDISREVFSKLFVHEKSAENRLFDLEIENSNDGDPRIILTDKGFVYQLYKKTDFQREFGGFKERQQALREFLEKK